MERELEQACRNIVDRLAKVTRGQIEFATEDVK